MVCKEDVLTWFKDLDSYKRIDFMYEVLNMCVPFEIRFLGSCIEEIGKHSYQELRGPTITANDIDRLSKDLSLIQAQGLLDECARHRTVIYISLLSARNFTCANWFYKNLLMCNKLEDYVVKGRCKDDYLLNEFLLLFTMTLHHPAFTFEQKGFFGKVVTQLLEQKEGKRCSSPKSNNYCYPPGFGYPTPPKIAAHGDIPIVPVKSASVVAFGDTPPFIQKFYAPSAMMSHHLDLSNQPIWQKQGYTCAVCPSLEPVSMLPPPPSKSPLVTQSGSPSASRAGSPQRPFSIQPVMSHQALPGHLIDVVTSQQPHMDSISQPSNLPAFIPDVKTIEENVKNIADDKTRENQWTPMYEFNPQNGIRYPCNKYRSTYLMEQFQGLNLENENSLHCSSSSSRSGTPPDTPCTTPSVIPQGPGRGDNKTRVNGLPPFMSNPHQMCEANQPPPPPPSYSNCSVPYSTFIQLPIIPNSQQFNYSQARFTYSVPFPFQPPDNYPPYQFPISSTQPIHRIPNCYNCGGNSHTGAECSGQTIEDITQKPYVLEYNPPLSDMDKT